MADTHALLLTDVTREDGSTPESYDRLLGKFVGELRKTFSSRSAKSVDDPRLFEVLHPTTNTLSYIFLLLGLASDRTNDLYVVALVEFLRQFDPIQARYAGPEWRQILAILRDVIERTRDLSLLSVFSSAILRMDPSGSTLTTSHLDFVDLCLLARRPRQALALLDKDIYYLPGTDWRDVDRQLLCLMDLESPAYITKESGISGEMNVLQVQEYYVMGALVYIGLRQYQRAISMLEMVIATPTVGNVASLYMVEAYKKLVLVSLIHGGKAPSISRLADSSVVKIIQNSSRPYDALSEAMRNRDLAKFQAEFDVGGTLWAEDNNVGLVQEALQSIHRHRVTDLQRTYAAVPVEQVATHLSLSLQSTTQLLQNMIQNGDVRATLESASSTATTNGTDPLGHAILTFNTSPSAALPTAAASATIKAQLARIQALSDAVNEADRKFVLTKEYVEHNRRTKRSDAGAAAFEDPMEMDMPFDTAARPNEDATDDEDIMAS